MDATLPIRPVWHGRRTALVFAHPGHEVLLHKFLEEAKPTVFVLADGSIATDEPAIRTTARIVTKAGGKIGGIFGRYTARGLQGALMMCEHERFTALVHELADYLIADEIDLVAGDAAEGIDPAHDLCRVLIDSAAAIAALTRPSLKNLELPMRSGRGNRGGSIRLKVTGDAWLRKFSQCRAYVEPVEEVRRLIETEGVDALREESLRITLPWSIRYRRDVVYANASAGRIAALRFREHFLPMVHALHRLATGSHSAAA